MNNETLDSFYIGLASGFIASFAVVMLVGYFKKLAAWRRYKWIKAEFEGYGYKPGTCVLDEHPQSRAEIRKSINNIFHVYEFDIIIEHGETFEWRWEGRLTMNPDTRDYGHIVWQYVKGPEGLLFGFKRCILNPEKKEIYLDGERGYGIEVLRLKNE